MANDSLDDLLDKLTHADPNAAEEIYRAYEPYLRMVVRRQLTAPMRARFDSADVVQSVWADLVQGFRENQWHFRDADHLRAFLVRVTRNRFIDRLRRQSAANDREVKSLAEGAEAVAEPHGLRPSQYVAADELWTQIVADCPPEHREILELKRSGHSLDEIARKTGLHKSSVRRILYKLARRWGVDPDSENS
jgi:RNA polymerase sigma-70 factor (ECF subfamily)